MTIPDRNIEKFVDHSIEKYGKTYKALGSTFEEKWEKEFDKYGCIWDDDDGLVTECIKNLIHSTIAEARAQGAKEERERLIELAKNHADDWGDLVVYGNDGIIEVLKG